MVAKRVTESNRDRLISQYAEAVVEDMNMKCMMELALDAVMHNLEMYSNDELEKLLEELNAR